jgi:hypothetical protein
MMIAFWIAVIAGIIFLIRWSRKCFHRSDKFIIVAEIPPFVIDAKEPGILGVYRVVLIPGGLKETPYICRFVDFACVGLFHRRDESLLCIILEQFEHLVRNRKKMLSLMLGAYEELLYVFVHCLHKLTYPLALEIRRYLRKFLPVRRVLYLCFSLKCPRMDGDLPALYSYLGSALRVHLVFYHGPQAAKVYPASLRSLISSSITPVLSSGSSKMSCCKALTGVSCLLSLPAFPLKIKTVSSAAMALHSQYNDFWNTQGYYPASSLGHSSAPSRTLFSHTLSAFLLYAGQE